MRKRPTAVNIWVEMAWRIHDAVVRGEIDNRRKGQVHGRLWLEGLPAPVVLELEGNAWPDLAGCLLKFRNRGRPQTLHLAKDFAQRQEGRIGDLTASRKVRTFDVPLNEALAMIRRGEKPPEHMANCLYLEWYSEANGRVVIETTECTLDISAPVWRLSAEEERQRQEDAAAGFAGFLGKLNESLEAQRHDPPEDKEWDEFDYEQLLRESDARTDKYGELLEKYADHPDRERLIAKEMGWKWLEEALDAEASGRKEEDDGSDGAPDPFDDEEALEPDPTTEGIDWERTDDGSVRHPLYGRSLKAARGLMDHIRQLPPGKAQDEDLATFLSEFRMTSAKLAGALNSLAYGRNLRDSAFIVAYLKRALGHLHPAQAALERVTSKQLLPTDAIDSLRRELFELREETLKLMTEFRKGPGPRGRSDN